MTTESIRARARAVLAVFTALVATATASLAATPSSGTITAGSPSVSYSGGPFDNVNPSGVPPPGPPSVVCASNVLPCDDFALTVTISPSDPHVYDVKASLSFTRPGADLDLYLLDSDGTIQAESLNGAGVQETVSIPGVPGTHTYTVRVVPYDVTTGTGGDTYAVTVSLGSLTAGEEPTDQPTVAGVPRFETYAAPDGLGDSAGEPSIGINGTSGNVMYQASLQTLRLSFDDCSSPAGTSWVDRSFVSTSRASLDAILFTDSRTNRTFVSQLTGACSAAAFTNDDGETYTPSQGCGTPAGVDHQTFGGGPFAPGPIGPTTSYPDAVYYCSQESATAFCALSRDGGTTFGPGIAAWNATQCDGIHGHIKVAPDGTAYVPNRDCNGDAVNGYVNQGLAVSTDNGTTWTVRFVTGSTHPKNDYLVDPAVGIGSGGRLYFGYQGSDGHPYAAVSDDRGATWHDTRDVGAAIGIKNATFPEMVAGDNGRAAFAFLGTLTDGDYGDDANFNGSWHLYVATTFDGGASWTTVDATPNDPVQRGSICNKGTTACDNTPDDRNLLDFMDIGIDAAGRILVGYPDGCITSSCIHGAVNDFTAKATIARQSGGKRLLAQFDPLPAEPVPPRAPRLSGKRTAPGVVHLAWSKPDNGGSDLTGYRIYRGTASGGETLLTTRPPRTGYDDITADPATAYYYRITALNAEGEGAFCNEVLVPTAIVPGEDPCTVPGVTVATDDSDAAPNTPATPAVDIANVSIAEPWVEGAPDALLFTLQVGEDTAAPASSQWYVIWNRTTPDSGADRNYVAMKTGPTGTISYEYGHVSPPNANLPTRLGTASGGSYNAATGTIRIAIANSLIDEVQAGQTLTGVQVRTFLGRPDGLPVTQTAASDYSPTGSYTLVGNASCRPNEAPTAVLTRTPAEGCAPLTVDFDASSSTDTDAGDTIASYQFDFGDGSPSVVQASPTISHTYMQPGDYGGRLLVFDSRGKQSRNVALQVVEVHEAPVAAATGTSTMCFGASTVLGGSGGDHCVWSPVAGLSDPTSCTPTASPGETTTYTLVVTNDEGCVSSNPAQVTVSVGPCAVDEVEPLVWLAGRKDTLTWPARTNATSYRLYRGVPEDLPNLLNANADSCRRFEGSATTTGPVLTELPLPAGSFYWYLVVGLSGSSLGPAGNSSAGPRIVDAPTACP